MLGSVKTLGLRLCFEALALRSRKKDVRLGIADEVNGRWNVTFVRARPRRFDMGMVPITKQGYKSGVETSLVGVARVESS
ncbi:MAG: hypothetical protein ACKOCN_10885, partial [Planctomycetaceae bacterium]